MAKGRKPIPTEQKRLKGTLRKSRENANEPKPMMVVEYPSPPERLNDFAISIWHKTVPELKQMGVLARVDMEHLTAYCIEMGRYNEANQLIKKNGSPITKSPSGYAMIHPWYTVARQSLKAATEIGALFGITPSARTKISVNKEQKKGLKSLLNGTE